MEGRWGKKENEVVCPKSNLLMGLIPPDGTLGSWRQSTGSAERIFRFVPNSEQRRLIVKSRKMFILRLSGKVLREISRPISWFVEMMDCWRFNFSGIRRRSTRLPVTVRLGILWGRTFYATNVITDYGLIDDKKQLPGEETALLHLVYNALSFLCRTHRKEATW